MLAVPNRIVSAATKKRNAKWGARNDHLLNLPLFSGLRWRLSCTLGFIQKITKHSTLDADASVSPVPVGLRHFDSPPAGKLCKEGSPETYKRHFSCFSCAHKLPVNFRFSIRDSTLSQNLITDHLSRGRRICARLAMLKPNITFIQEYFQDIGGTISFPPRSRAISAASSKISSLSG